jgi:hypothetical protein
MKEARLPSLRVGFHHSIDSAATKGPKLFALGDGSVSTRLYVSSHAAGIVTAALWAIPFRAWDGGTATLLKVLQTRKDPSFFLRHQ